MGWQRAGNQLGADGGAVFLEAEQGFKHRAHFWRKSLAASFRR